MAASAPESQETHVPEAPKDEDEDFSAMTVLGFTWFLLLPTLGVSTSFFNLHYALGSWKQEVIAFVALAVGGYCALVSVVALVVIFSVSRSVKRGVTSVTTTGLVSISSIRWLWSWMSSGATIVTISTIIRPPPGWLLLQFMILFQGFFLSQAFEYAKAETNPRTVGLEPSEAKGHDDTEVREPDSHCIGNVEKGSSGLVNANLQPAEDIEASGLVLNEPNGADGGPFRYSTVGEFDGARFLFSLPLLGLLLAIEYFIYWGDKLPSRYTSSLATMALILATCIVLEPCIIGEDGSRHVGQTVVSRWFQITGIMWVGLAIGLTVAHGGVPLCYSDSRIDFPSCGAHAAFQVLVWIEMTLNLWLTKFM